MRQTYVLSTPIPPVRRAPLSYTEPITAVPLVFATVVSGHEDIIVFISKGGNVWMIQKMCDVGNGKSTSLLYQPADLERYRSRL